MTVDEERLVAMDAILARIEAIGQTAPSLADEISYGWLPGDLSEKWDEVLARLRDGLDRCLRLTGAERIVHDGERAASAVGWMGDLDTVWSASITPERCPAHFALIDAHIRRRSRMVRIVTASVRVAATLATLAASPLGAVAALHSLTSLVAELQAAVQADPGQLNPCASVSIRG
jgi:hypothetical protein